MAGTSADGVKSSVTEAQNKAIEFVDEQYRDYFLGSEKAMNFIEKANTSLERKLADKEALLLQKTILQDYLFCQAREIILEKDRIFNEKIVLISENTSLETELAEKEVLISEKERVIVQKENMLQEMNLVIHQKNLIISQKDSAIDDKDSAIAEQDELIAHKNELILEKDLIIARSSSLIPMISAAAAGVLVGIFFKQRNS